MYSTSKFCQPSGLDVAFRGKDWCTTDEVNQPDPISLREPGYTSYCHPPFTCDSLAKYCNKDIKPLKVQVYSPLTLHAVAIFLMNAYVPRVINLYRVLAVIYLRDLILFLDFLFFLLIFLSRNHNITSLCGLMDKASAS